jgi:PmbA protein
MKTSSSLFDHSDTLETLNIQDESHSLHSMGNDLMKYAKKKGASQIEIGMGVEAGLSVSVRHQSLDTLEHYRNHQCVITVYFNQKKGVVSSSERSLKGLQQAIDAACNIAKYTQEDIYSGLAQEELMAKKSQHLDLDHPIHITPQEAIDSALLCESAGLDLSTQIVNTDGATLTSHRSLYQYMNSHGFLSIIPSTYYSAHCGLLAEDRYGKQRDYYFSVARDKNDLTSLTDIGKIAAKRTLKRLNPKKIKTQKAHILFTPEMAKTLIAHFKSAITGANLYRKSSFLVDQLECSIFPHFFNIEEKPWIKKGLASAWHDKDGLATQEQALVHNGQLKTYLLNSYSAKKLKMPPTPHAGGTHNLYVQSTGESFKELVTMLNKGLIVTEMMGQGVNAISGDYSRGASGFWVENGEIQHFVEEITIAGNLKTMFSNIIAVGNDIDDRSGTLTGSWLLPDMMIAAS